MLRLLERFDIEIVDASEVRKVHPMRTFGGWQCKPYAILHSPFEKVILLDADNFALHDPALLLDTPELETLAHCFGRTFHRRQSVRLSGNYFGFRTKWSRNSRAAKS